MKRLSILVFQYYRTLLLYNMAFTVLCFVLTGLGAGFNPMVLLFCKLCGFTGAAGLHYYSAFNTYFYYRNSGMSIRRLFVYTCLADALISLILIVPLTIILYAAPNIKG